MHNNKSIPGPSQLFKNTESNKLTGKHIIFLAQISSRFTQIFSFQSIDEANKKLQSCSIYKIHQTDQRLKYLLNTCCHDSNEYNFALYCDLFVSR